MPAAHNHNGTPTKASSAQIMVCSLFRGRRVAIVR